MPAAWAPGTSVGDYVVVEPLGAGGMGQVYRVRHARTGTHYALKTLSGVSDPEHLARFEREGQAQARVDAHPNVVRVHALERADGQPYLVMDLAAGGDLATRLRRGPLPPREAAAMVRDLARGLAHVHACGVLHRDLKPENVLFGERGTPKLVDFGLATLPDAESLTHTGAILGSPAYMAPEQAQGQREAIDARTDVYGLGAVLYAALTAHPPFRGGHLIALLSRVAEEPPTPPSELAPVPPALEAICLGALAKRPEARPPSAAALAEALERFLEEPDAAPRPGWLAPAALLTLLTLIGGAAFGLARAPDPPAEASLGPTTPTAAPEPAPSLAPAPRDPEGPLGLRAIDAFLRAHPDHPEADRLRVQRRRLVRAPLLTIQLPRLIEAELGPDGERLFALSQPDAVGGQSSLQCFGLDGAPEWEAGLPASTGGLVVTSDRVAVTAYSEIIVLGLDGTRLARRATPAKNLHHLAVDPERGVLVAGGIGPLIACDWPSLANRRALLSSRDIGGVAFDARGRLFAISKSVNTAQLHAWERLTAPPTERVLGLGPTTISAGPAWVAIGYTHGNLSLHDPNGQAEPRALRDPRTRYSGAHEDKVYAVAFAGDRAYSVSSSKTPAYNDLRCWSLPEGRYLGRTTFGAAARPRHLSLSADGLVAVSLFNHGVQVWSIEGLGRRR